MTKTPVVIEDENIIKDFKIGNTVTKVPKGNLAANHKRQICINYGSV